MNTLQRQTKDSETLLEIERCFCSNDDRNCRDCFVESLLEDVPDMAFNLGNHAS